jgi:hypothetical protein
MGTRATSASLVMLAVVALTPLCSRGDPDSVCLSFDPSDILACQPDITTYPHTFQAYLVLRNCSSPGGVGGWEATIDLSDGLMLGVADFGAGAINSGSGTSFHVVYSSPRAQSHTMILATLTFEAETPASIYVHGYDPPSIAETFAPVYLDGADSSRHVVMTYSCGSPFHPVLTIGRQNCPSEISTPPFASTIPDTATVPDQVGEFIESSTAAQSPEPRMRLSDTDLDYLTSHSAIVARGRLLSKRKHYVLVNGVRTGLAVLTFQVSDVICGPQVDSLVVVARGVDFPGKLRYDGTTRFSKYDDLPEGGEALVSATLLHDVFWTHDSRIFSLSDPAASEQQLLQLQGLHRALRPPSQAADADVVALLSPTADGSSYNVVALYKGSRPGGPVHFGGLDDDYVLAALSSCHDPSCSALCFAMHLDGNEYRLLNGCRSVFVAGNATMLDHLGYGYSLQSFSAAQKGASQQ